METQRLENGTAISLSETQATFQQNIDVEVSTEPYEEQHPVCFVIVILPHSPEGSRDIGEKSSNRKYFWRVANQAHVCGLKNKPIVYGVPHQYLDYSSEDVASITPEPEFFGEALPESQRGILCVPYDREVIFSKEISFETSKLQKWTPQIIIHRRAFELDDE
jgi:hypothetical protein